MPAWPLAATKAPFPKEGVWRREFSVNGDKLPFNFEVKGRGEKAVAEFHREPLAHGMRAHEAGFAWTATPFTLTSRHLSKIMSTND